MLSFNELSGKLSYERVESTYQKYRDTIITIHAYGTFIETTTEHPFFVKGEWRRADALKAGMSLTLASGEEAAIEQVEMRLERTAVYNFSVANNHTYTVGNVQFLVHNCDGIQKVNGQNPKNAVKYAGKVYNFEKGTTLGKKYPNGVKFSEAGFPDFSPYKIAEVDLKVLNKGSSTDIAHANKIYKQTTGKDVPTDYVWHHVENSTKLQLIPRDLHDAVKHTGGRATNAPR